jgi:hypothetical protein
MKNIGRLRDLGLQPAWGPGRHGPGNNVFAYFITPFGASMEYTAEVQQVDDSYRVGTPDDWKWPPNRIDHWGVSTRDNARLGGRGDFGFAHGSCSRLHVDVAARRRADYPTRPVRLIMPNAGSSIDTVGRLVACAWAKCSGRRS